MMSNTLETIRFNNSFARLSEDFYSRVKPTPLQANTHLISFNHDVAELIGLDPAQQHRSEFCDYFTGQKSWPGSDPQKM